MEIYLDYSPDIYLKFDLKKEKHNNALQEGKSGKKSILVEGESNRKWTGHIDPGPDHPFTERRSDRKKKSKSIDLIFHGD